MKKKIRSSVFETNSSSMHTLTLKNSDETKDFVLELDKDGYLHIETGDYSDLKKDLKEVSEILSFVASWIVEYGYYNGWAAEHDWEGNPSPDEMRSFKGFDVLENIVKKHTGTKGIIIEEIKKSEFPSGESLNIKEEEMFDPDVMEQLIFGKGSYVKKWWWRKIDKAIERMLDAREKNKTVVLLIILVLLLLFISVYFLQDFEARVVHSPNEIQSENEIKNFSIPEIIYKSFESKIKEKGNSNFKIITSVEKFNNMTFVEKNKELADIQKILRNNEIEKECIKDFYELSSTIYCRRRIFSYER